MYFSRIELRRDAEAASMLARRVSGEGYRLHQLLWNLFKGEGERKFLYRRVEESNWPRFYVVSETSPVNAAELWRIEVKPYVPQLAVGQRLAFSLCANPVVNRQINENGKSARHDVVMDAKFKLKQSGTDFAQPIALPELIRKTGFAWLVARAEGLGFAVREEQVRIDGYRQQRLYKSAKSHPICFSTLEFDGLLTVIDPDRLKHTLYHGIGPAKSFGCGLLLVRRV